jgi:hypothetical protein
MEEKLLNTLKMEHKTLQEQINELNKQMREKSKDLMKEAFREFFTKYDEVVENIYWTQYTPHFNDGEACEFGVNDVFILLKDDEEACAYEGSSLYDQDSIKNLKEQIAKWEAWEKDPMAEARKHQLEYIKKYNRNPFDPEKNSYSYGRYGSKKTEEELMREWKPHYVSKESCKEQLQTAEMIVSKYPNLQADFKEIKIMVGGLEENLMRAMFGDHAKVVVSTNGIEIEEYNHD